MTDYDMEQAVTALTTIAEELVKIRELREKEWELKTARATTTNKDVITVEGTEQRVNDIQQYPMEKVDLLIMLEGKDYKECSAYRKTLEREQNR